MVCLCRSDRAYPFLSQTHANRSEEAEDNRKDRFAGARLQGVLFSISNVLIQQRLIRSICDVCGKLRFRQWLKTLFATTDECILQCGNYLYRAE
jgi:hypothetical protein